jgi:hypothetical protein
VMCLTDRVVKHLKVDRCSEVVSHPSHLVFLLPIDGGPMPMEVFINGEWVEQSSQSQVRRRRQGGTEDVASDQP